MQIGSRVSTIVTDGAFDLPGLVVIRISKGKISRISHVIEEDLLRIDLEADDLYDARGLMVLPGLIDSHVHLIGSALYLLAVDLNRVSSLDEVVSRLRGAERLRSGILLGGRLDVSLLPTADRERLPRVLEEAFSYPVCIRSVEHHSAFLNQKAWELLEVTELAKKLGLPKDAVADMKDEMRIKGKLYEAVAERLYDSFSEEERKKALWQFLDKLPQRGVTCLHCLEGYGSDPEADFRVILDVSEARPDIDLILYPRTSDVRVVKKYGLKRMGGCILIDGAVGARTAAFSLPYADKPDSSGTLYFSDDSLRALLASALKEGIQLAVHAIGDSAIEQVLSIYEELARQYDVVEIRPRIEHFCAGTPGQFERAQRLGLASGIQPAFDLLFGGSEGVYAQALGTERALQMNPIKTALYSGMLIGGGSDSPITSLDPLLGIYSACNHNNENERVSFPEAVELFTINNARLAHEEAFRGKIKEGYLADFVILPKETTAQNVKDIQPVAVMKNGVLTWILHQ